MTEQQRKDINEALKIANRNWTSAIQYMKILYGPMGEHMLTSYLTRNRE